MIKNILEQNVDKFLIGIGGLILIGGLFDVQDITKFQVTIHSTFPSSSIIAIGIGIILILIGISIFIITYFDLGLGIFNSIKIKIEITNGKYTTNIDRTKLIIHFGKIEEIEKTEGNSVVILPANEFFDDECIHDKDSSLGAYIQKYYKNQEKEIQKLVLSSLDSQNLPKILVEKEKGKQKESYGIGTSVFLDNPLNTKEKIILVSVTEKRAGKSLYSNISFIFNAINKVCSIISDKRINSIYIPLLGSGHGGVRKEVALFSLILAFTENIKKGFGSNINSINIVIFQKEAKSKPEIRKNIAKKIIKFAIQIASPRT